MTNEAGESSEELRAFLLSTPKGVSDLLKTVAHSKRLQVLALLLNENSKAFLTLQHEISSSKTALANHLAQLMDKGLIERIDRGNYRITRDGKELLETAAKAYLEVSNRRYCDSEQHKKHYIEGFKSLGEFHKVEKMVHGSPEYQNCPISYLGAVTGALKGLGANADVMKVGGYSGYVFLMNVAKGGIYSSALNFHKAWNDIHKGLELFGWKIEEIKDEESFPPTHRPLNLEDTRRAKEFFERIKAEIDQHNRPVVLWGIPTADFGIVKGYTKDSYIVSTLRRLNNQPDPPIRYDALLANRNLRAFFFREKPTFFAEHDDKKIILRAISMAKGNSYAQFGYIAGPAAFDEWADVLEMVSKDSLSYNANSYMIMCIHESKDIAASFLHWLSEKHATKCQAILLTSASKEYRKAEKLMQQLSLMFPRAWKGDLPLESRKKEAAILRNVKSRELRAIELMQKSVEVWE